MSAWSTHAYSVDAFSVGSAERGRSGNVYEAEADVDFAAQGGAPLPGWHADGEMFPAEFQTFAGPLSLRIRRERHGAMTARDGSGAMLTVAEVCAELRVTRSTFNDWRAKKCAPPCVRLPNRQLRFRRADLDHWIASRADAAA